MTNGPVDVRFYLTPEAFERLWLIAALEGVSFTDALNRSVQFYDAVLQCPEGRSVSLLDDDGSRRLTVNTAYNIHHPRRPVVRDRRRAWWWPFGRTHTDDRPTP